MCTRFYVEPQSFHPLIIRAQKLKLADDMMRVLAKKLDMSGEMRPSDMAVTLAPNKSGGIAVFPMIWGFSHKAVTVPIVNCRIENADKKDIWKDSWFRRRCVIPASWYLEWEHYTDSSGKKKTGAKYMIQSKGASTTYLAGLYRFEEQGGLQVPVFSIITRDAVGDLKDIHDRMPLILRREDIGDWIRPDGNPQEISKKAVSEVVFEKAG